jgi:small ligand-binding sensory domain FIST
MRWVNVLSLRPSLEAAVEEAVNLAQERLGEKTADLGFMFISSAFASEYPRLLPLIRERLAIDHLIGCGGGGIVGMQPIGGAKEVEQEPAARLLLVACAFAYDL